MECWICQKQGHLAKMCCKKWIHGKENVGHKAEVHNTAEEEEVPEAKDSVYTMFNVTSKNQKEKLLQVDVTINGQRLIMVTGTGASRL